MAKSRKLEELLAELDRVRHDPTSELGMETLASILSSKHSIAVAQVAQIVGESEIYSLIPQLASAFNRFMLNAKDSDPGCRAKQAIAESLYRLSYSDEELFLKGIQHVQMEPVWGGQIDTAPRLRGTCGLGLVRMNYPLVMVELADLLADSEPEARIGAVRAIAYSENDQGVPLLRLRVKIGDTPAVMLECLIALLKLASQSSLPLIKDLLYVQKQHELQDMEKAEAAALALGESRLPEAFPILREWWQQVIQPEMKRTGLLAIATLRQDQALEFLLSLIANGTLMEAKDALKALSIYRQEAALWSRVCQTTEQRQDAALMQIIEKASKSLH